MISEFVIGITTFAAGMGGGYAWWGKRNGRPHARTPEQQKAADSTREVGQSTFELRLLLERLCRHVVEISGSQACTMYLPETRSHALIPMGASRPHEAPHRTEGFRGMIDRVYQSGRAMVAAEGNGASDPRGASYAALPLRAGGRVMGVVQVEGAAGRLFSRQDLRLLEIMADQAAFAVEKVQAYHEVQRIAEKFAMIVDVGSALGGNMDLEDMLQLIAKAACEELEGWACSLRLADERGETLAFRAAWGPGREHVYQGPVAVGHSVAGRVFQSRQPIVIPEIQEDARFDHAEMATAGRLHSLVSVPVMDKNGRCLGTLTIYHADKRFFASQDVKLLSALAAQAAVAIENARLFANARAMYLNTIKAIAAALSARDLYTGSHSDEASQLSKILADELGLDGSHRELVEYGAILHDIGKIGISDRILDKPDKLTDEEYTIMKQHPLIGAKILEPLEEFKELAHIIAHHHEHFDGTGYPDGLRHEQIPLVARILHVVDAFHAMTSDRPYRKALPRATALDELRRGCGSQFDPHVVEALFRAVEKRRV